MNIIYYEVILIFITRIINLSIIKVIIRIKYNGKPIKYKMISDKHSICESNCEQSGEINSNFNLKETLTAPNIDLKKSIIILLIHQFIMKLII